MRIAFWGTPAFAVPSLARLAEAGHEVSAVVTRPDRPVGRGRRQTAPAVKEAAAALGLGVLQPVAPREPGLREALAKAMPELSVVVAYGHLMPTELLELPALGSINVHASLLPELRGAAPIAWAIARGYAETGITVIRMTEEMDAGPVLASARTALGESESAAGLSKRLALLGAETIVEVVNRLEEGPVPEVDQDHARATFAPKISRAMAQVRWDGPARELARFVRAMDDKPGAWSELDGTPVKLFAPSATFAPPAVQDHASSAPGTVIRADAREGLVVACGEGALVFGEVQPAGGRRMSAKAWIAGRGASAGRRFA